MIDLAGETAFRAFLGAEPLCYKISKFVFKKGLELWGVQELADSNFEFLTLTNLVSQSNQAYMSAVYRVRGGDQAIPDPEAADTSAEALNQVYYTFEACKYTMNEVYDFLIKDSVSMYHTDLDAQSRYITKKWKLEQVSLSQP